MTDPNRKHPRLMPLRVTEAEARMIRRVADDQGRTMADLLRSIVLPAITERIGTRERPRDRSE